MSTRIFVNLHRPEYEVGQLDRDGSPKHAAIGRPTAGRCTTPSPPAAPPGCGASISAPTGFSLAFR